MDCRRWRWSSIRPSPTFFSGHRAILNLVRGEVRYPCDGCSSLTWRTREWLTIYYPEVGGHITLVGPPGIELENLVNFISIK